MGVRGRRLARFAAWLAGLACVGVGCRVGDGAIGGVMTELPPRLREIAEELFTEAVAQGFHSSFSLDCWYWGREYAAKLIEALEADEDA